MKTFNQKFILRHKLAIDCLVATTVLIVVTTLIRYFFGSNFYFSNFDFFPVNLPFGAFLSGFLVTLGSTFGRERYPRKRNNVLILQILFIAITAQLIFYYLDYQVLVHEHGNTNSGDFLTYIDNSMTGIKHRFKRGVDGTYPIGRLGYITGFLRLPFYLLPQLHIYEFDAKDVKNSG